MHHPTSVRLEIPQWLQDNDITGPFESDRAKMQFVLDLTEKNVENDTGGPFGAAVFCRKSGKLISTGVNVVIPMTCSLAHAEVMAMMLAQKTLGMHRLRPGYELYSSAQPCFMCTGALLWSGLDRLVYAADKEDVESILGFDEGPVPDGIGHELEARNIRVTEHLLRTRACAILDLYKQKNGIIY